GVNKLQLEDYGDKYIYDIVGVYHPEYVNSYIAIANLPVIVNDNLYNKLKDENKGYYMSLIAPMPYNVSDIEKLLRFNFSVIKNGVHYSLSNEAMSVWVYIQNYYLEMLFYSLLYHGYLVGSIALALYIRLLYIGSKYKRKEIEILRNMGASKADLLAIMIGENCVLALILYAVSLLITFIGTIGLNLYIQLKYLIRLSLFAFGLKEVLVLFALTALFFVITSLKSIIFISRKKPFIK
ncbi:MAG TPA: ABC transporter permease, partial [Clostridia bacterium]